MSSFFNPSNNNNDRKLLFDTLVDHNVNYVNMELVDELLSHCKNVPEAVDYFYMNEYKYKTKYNNNAELSREQKVISLRLLSMGFTIEQIKSTVTKYNNFDDAIASLIYTPMPEKIFQCQVCMEDVKASDMVTLDCDHRICIINDCFKNYCISRITDNKVSDEDFVCPVDQKCKTPISIHIIKAHVPEDIFIKYETFQLRRECELSNFCRCPKCNEWYVDLRDAVNHEDIWKKIKCENQQCVHEFCGKCGQKPHKGQKDQDCTCEDYQKWLAENEKGDDEAINYMKNNKIFPCPKCKMYGALESGCKFIYCRCKANFCALCGIQLKEPQHFSHFTNGPFGDTCKGVVDTAGVDK